MFWDACNFEDIKRINSSCSLPWLDWRDAPERVEWARLPFYDDHERDPDDMEAAEAQGWQADETYRLVRVTPRLNRDEFARYEQVGVFYLIDSDGDVSELDGSSGPIHEANSYACLMLDHRDCFAYLGFFCDFVTAQGAPFTLSRTLADLRLSTDRMVEPSEVRRRHKLVRDIVRLGRETSYYQGCSPGSTHCAESEDDDEYLINGIVSRKRGAHLAEFCVTYDGKVEMLESEVLAPEGSPAVGLEVETFTPEFAEKGVTAFGVRRID